MKNILRLQDISKSFLFEGRNVLVLKDIELEVAEHEFVTIIGSSGCGKSTLLELIAGITIPDSGRIYLQGEDVTGKAGKFGYMPQSDLLLPWLSLLDNALLPSRIRRADLLQEKEKAQRLIREFGLEDYADYKPAQLSGGMKQRAAFLRTVMTEAEILLLDEPFANLDALTRLQMQQWLLSIRSGLRQTIILVTHDIDEAIRLSDRIYVMDSQPGAFIGNKDIPDAIKAAPEGSSHPLWQKIRAELSTLLIR